MNRDDFLSLLNSNQWSNAACLGYVIKACKALDYSENEISELIETLNTEYGGQI